MNLRIVDLVRTKGLLWRIGALAFGSTLILLVQAYASPSEPQPASPIDTASRSNQCAVLSITTPESKKANIRDFLEQLEDAIRKNAGTAFVTLLHPAILKDGEVKQAIFENLMENYDLKGKVLQKRFLYELSLEGPNQQTLCADHKVSGVVGPREQWAIEYTTTSGGEQARLFFLIGRIPESMRKHTARKSPKAPTHELGIVHIHTQHWTFGGQTPDSLFAESRKWSVLNEPAVSWAFFNAASRIAVANSYLIDRRFEKDLADEPRIQSAFEQTTKASRDQLIPGTGLTVRQFATVFKDRSVEIGVKLEATEEIAVNDQISQCRTMTRQLAPLFAGGRKKLNGLECLIYRTGEPLDQAPSGGTIFTSFNDALSPTKE
jgi:hypothetical protein